MKKKKNIFITIFVVGILLIGLGVGFKLLITKDTKDDSNNKTNETVVKDAITGEITYYEENGKVVITYDAKNKSDKDVTVKKLKFTLKEAGTEKSLYTKEFTVNKLVKTGKNKKIILEGIELALEDLHKNVILIDAEY